MQCHSLPKVSVFVVHPYSDSIRYNYFPTQFYRVFRCERVAFKDITEKIDKNDASEGMERLTLEYHSESHGLFQRFCLDNRTNPWSL